MGGVPPRIRLLVIPVVAALSHAGLEVDEALFLATNAWATDPCYSLAGLTTAPTNTTQPSRLCSLGSNVAPTYPCARTHSTERFPRPRARRTLHAGRNLLHRSLLTA